MSRRAVRVVKAGPLCTVQDMGRQMVGQYGVSPGGVVDRRSARAANLLVGNEAGAALLETTASGASLELLSPARVAVTGARAAISIGGQSAMVEVAVHARAGDTIIVEAPGRGFRCYIAFDGGVDVRPLLGSRSTDVAAGFGGFAGRPLRVGDVLPLGLGFAFPAEPAPGPALDGPPTNGPFTVRVLPGPDADAAVAQDLCAQTYQVSEQSNRQGLRLRGKPVAGDRRADILTAGAAAGYVQVPSDGLPIILLSEHQATAGYASALCVIAADLPVVAQLAPGDELRFEMVSRADARAALHRVE